MKFLFYASALFLLSACAGPQDELKIMNRSDGTTEISVPYSASLAVMEGQGMQTERIVSANAQKICPDGYSMNYTGVRKRPEYADPEKVWIVTCKP